MFLLPDCVSVCRAYAHGKKLYDQLAHGADPCHEEPLRVKEPEISALAEDAKSTLMYL
jgi:hypothetical protein